MRPRRQSAAADAVGRRVQALAGQWRPLPADEPAHDGDPRGLDALRVPAPPDDPWRRATTGARWSPSAVRALLAILAVAIGVAVWWWWSGRPQEVIVTAPPVVVATGSPVTGLPVPSAGPAESEPEDPPMPALPSAPRATSAAAPAMAPASVPAAAGTPSAPADLVVHVSGDVARPGVVRLAPGSRVADAVAAAGGVTRRRAADSVNLARPVVDGEQIVVDASIPATNRPPQPASSTGQASMADGVANAPGGGPPGTALGGSVGAPLVLDLNVADAAALETLPGVGPVLAGRILQWRADNGRFTSVDELGEVSGIGDATLARLRPLVRV